MSHAVYVITGASRGIGFELTRQLLLAGHTVLAGVRKPERAEVLNALCSDYSKTLKIFPVDVRDDDSVTTFARAIALENKPINVLINNAGVYLNRDSGTAAVELSAIQETLATNTLGPIRVTKALLALLKKAPRAKIINITSQMGSIGDNSSGNYLAYRMSKAALNMFTKCLSLDEKEIITLSIHPGWVQTEMGGSNAPIKAGDSAKGILQVIEQVNPNDSGRFLNYLGKEIEW